MSRSENQTAPKRRYPPFWEKVVPIAIGVIAVVVVILLLVIIAVALGLLPGAG
jgi:hypothetical protein